MKYTITFLTLFISLVSFSQTVKPVASEVKTIQNNTSVSNGSSRVNDATLSFLSQTEKITNANGWKKNKSTGKWINNSNVIDDKKVETYWISHIEQNFKYIQIKSIVYQNQKYYVLIFESVRGSYKYPNISQDWTSYLETHFFIITKEQYSSFKNKVQSRTGENIKIESKMKGVMSGEYKALGGQHSYNEENLLAKIKLEFETKYHSSKYFLFNSQNVDGNAVVRFTLPTSSRSTIENNLDTEYFEIKLEEFSKLVSLN